MTWSQFQAYKALQREAQRERGPTTGTTSLVTAKRHRACSPRTPPPSRPAVADEDEDERAGYAYEDIVHSALSRIAQIPSQDLQRHEGRSQCLFP